MKRIYLLLLLTVSLAIFPQNSVFNSIKERKNLIVAITKSDQPPFFYIDKDGELKGFDIDIAKNMASKLGVGVIFNRDAESFNALIPIIESGEADIAISKLSRTMARAQNVLYSKPYIQLHQALLINRLELAKTISGDNELIHFIKDFRGKLGVIKNSSYERYAKTSFPNATIISYENWDDIVNAVFNGDILAAYRDDLEIKKIIKLRNDSALKVKTVVLKDTVDNIAMAINNREILFQQWVNIFLEEEYSEQLSAEWILDTYLGEE